MRKDNLLTLIIMSLTTFVARGYKKQIDSTILPSQNEGTVLFSNSGNRHDPNHGKKKTNQREIWNELNLSDDRQRQRMLVKRNSKNDKSSGTLAIHGQGKMRAKSKRKKAKGSRRGSVSIDIDENGHGSDEKNKLLDDSISDEIESNDFDKETQITDTSDRDETTLDKRESSPKFDSENIEIIDKDAVKLDESSLIQENNIATENEDMTSVETIANIDEPSLIQENIAPAENEDVTLDETVENKDESSLIKENIVSINNEDGTFVETVGNIDESSLIQENIVSTNNEDGTLDESSLIPSLENQLSSSKETDIFRAEENKVEPDFGFEFVFTTLSPTPEPTNQSDDEDKIGFEIIFATPSPSPIFNDESLTDVTCSVVDSTATSKINVEYFYTVETSNDDTDTILDFLENKMLHVVAFHLCPKLDRRNLIQSKIYSGMRQITTDASSSGHSRRLEVINVDSSPRDEILSDTCIPEVATNTCTQIRGEMTAHFSGEGQNSNSELVAMNVILALKFAMSEDEFANEDIGLHKVTYMVLSTPKVETTQIINEPDQQSSMSIAPMTLVLSFFAFLGMIVIFAVQKKKNRNGHGIEADKSIVFSDFDTNSSTSGSPSALALYGSELYRIDTIKEESEASCSDDESDSGLNRNQSVAEYYSHTRSPSIEVYLSKSV